MDSNAAKQAIKTLIEANTATLLPGLTAQGVARTIGHVTTSVLTPAIRYFYIAVHQMEADSHSRVMGANMQRPPRETSHDMVVHVEDYAIGAAGDDELFEVAHQNFDDFVDRIQTLIEAQTWIPDGVSSPRFRLPRAPETGGDRQIIRSDALQQWADEAQQYHSMLYAQLRFTLVEC